MSITRQITSVSHPLVKHLVKLRQNHSYRQEHQSVVVEGLKPVAEVCRQQQAKVILTYDESLVPKDLRNNELIQVDEKVMGKISGMVHPEGLLAEVVMPAESRLEKCRYIVALDAVSEPGNMGTLLRTALALGWEGAFILGEGCDPYNEKAMRAARGACFRLPMRHGSWKDLEELILKNRLTAFVADLEGVPSNQISSSVGAVLVLSNEARGPSADALKIGQKVTVPISAEMESLNVAAAGAILMYVIKNK